MPALTDSLFFAIYPDPPAAVRIAELAQRLNAEHGLKGRPAATERFHVTLHHLGAFAGLPDEVVARAREAASNVFMPPVDVEFDRVSSFPGRRNKKPLVLRAGAEANAGALHDFQKALGVALQAAGLAVRAGSRFTPHVTLLYDERGLEEQRTDPIGWRVDEFFLVRSLLGKSHYVKLARWPLCA
jgi:2'-5' RNA ligase